MTGAERVVSSEPRPPALDAIRERAEAATRGPWKATRYTSPDAPTTGGWSKADKERYGWVSFSRKRDEPYTTSPLEHPDAVFIAHARADIPYLLDQLAAERADRERLHRLLDDAIAVQRNGCDHRGIGAPGCRICDPRVRDTAP